MISRVLTLLVALAAGYPLLAAVVKGSTSVPLAATQLVIAAIVLAGYLLVASRNT
jgi:hypothetical protein